MRRLSCDVNAPTACISIHAAREGGDGWADALYTSAMISIHAAREGGDQHRPLQTAQVYQFQSTPPVKAATRHRGFPQTAQEFQSTPPVKAATAV